MMYTFIQHIDFLIFKTELALVTNKPRAASVYAVGTTRCAGE